MQNGIKFNDGRLQENHQPFILGHRGRKSNNNSRPFKPFLCSLHWVDVEMYPIDWCVCADVSDFVRSLSITPPTVWQPHCNVCV